MDVSCYSLSVGIFTWLLQYFPQKEAILVRKLWGEKKLSKSVFCYFKTKKKSSDGHYKLEGGGGGKAIMAWPLMEAFFCGFPKGKTKK